MTAYVLHAALPEDWATACRTGAYAISTRGRTLAEEGFIHASTSTQLDGVLGAFYSDLDELVLLVLDITALRTAGSPVLWEPVPGQPLPFPHVYGVIPSSVVGQGNPVVAAPSLRRDAGSDTWPWRALVSAYAV